MGRKQIASRLSQAVTFSLILPRDYDPRWSISAGTEHISVSSPDPTVPGAGPVADNSYIPVHYREAATEIRARTVDQLRRQISEHVGDLCVKITERQLGFLGMEFDKNWNCFLLRKDGKKATWEDTNTSAGQRQVRMLAFYEALRRLAKLVPPLVVDTPLGRLDKEVKDSVLDQLYLTGHQTIILTTNSEIDPESPLFEEVGKKLARVYTLHPQGREDSINYEVEISNDYFGRKL